MSNAKDNEYSALCFKAISDLGPQKVAKFLHVISVNCDDQKFAALTSEYRGFIDKTFKRKTLFRVFPPIYHAFIAAYLERRFVSFISTFEGSDGEIFTKEWVEEFHYYYWANFVKTHSTLIGSVYSETSQEEICNILQLFKRMPATVKEQQFAAFLNILYSYPNQLLSKNEIDDISYKTEEEWYKDSLPYNTRPILAKTAFEGLLESATNVCSNIVTVIVSDLDKYNTIVKDFDNNYNKFENGTKPFIDKEYISEVLPATPLITILLTRIYVSGIFNSRS